MARKLKKILIVAPVYPSADDPGRGVFIKNFAIELEKQAIEVKVLAIRKSVFRFKDHKSQNLFEIHFLPTLIPKLFGRFIFAINKIYLLLNLKSFNNFRPDLIYSHFLIGAIYGDLISNKLNVPHYIGIGEDVSYLKSLKDNLFGKSFFKKTLENSQLIISVSPSNMMILHDFFSISNSKLKLLTNAINLNLFKPFEKDKINWKKNKNFSNQFVISFIGDFNDRKGVFRLLKAVENLNDIKLILIGKGEFINNEKICFQGPLIQKEVVKWLNRSDLFVLPTLAEGWCNALNEAIACGIPIATSNIPSVKDQMEGVIYEKFDPQNINEIKEAIIKVKNDINHRKLMSDSCIAKSSDLSIENRTKKFIDFY